MAFPFIAISEIAAAIFAVLPLLPTAARAPACSFFLDLRNEIHMDFVRKDFLENPDGSDRTETSSAPSPPHLQHGLLSEFCQTEFSPYSKPSYARTLFSQFSLFGFLTAHDLDRTRCMQSHRLRDRAEQEPVNHSLSRGPARVNQSPLQTVSASSRVAPGRVVVT